jgi:hypothetical protein
VQLEQISPFQIPLIPGLLIGVHTPPPRKIKIKAFWKTEGKPRTRAMFIR